MNIKEYSKEFDERFVDTVCSCRSIDCPKFRGIKSFINEVYKEAWNEGRESVVEEMKKLLKSDGVILIEDIAIPHQSLHYQIIVSDVITKLSELKENK